eukprot:c19848_g1_i2.p1 GENE.c19848_g1_i2~~c19848_g1_i2.p1  ORF type:complete len:1335 (-),score=344.46 c19848_g1_i2:102-3599(-)
MTEDSEDERPSKRKKPTRRLRQVDDFDPKQFTDIRRSARAVQPKTYVDEYETDSDEREITKTRQQIKEEEEKEDMRIKRIEKVLEYEAPTDWSPDSPDAETSLLENGRFLVKWARHAVYHGRWLFGLELAETRGYQVVQRFTKKLVQKLRWLKHEGTREDLETYDMNIEIDKETVRANQCVERVIAIREAKPLFPEDTYVGSEYLVKWASSDYKECTWEREEVMTQFQKFVDEFQQRQTGEHMQSPYSEAEREALGDLNEQPAYIPLPLRDYQLEGVKWITNQYQHKINVILADEMGLGKTVQTISFLSTLHHRYNVSGPHLVIVPLSTLSNWQKEFSLWAPMFNVVVYVGEQDGRQIVRECEWHCTPKRARRPIVAFNVLLTSFEIILKDKAHLQEFKWCTISVDEAHRLKNNDSELYKALETFSSDARLLVTGTPLQNSIRELWSLLHFLDPTKFDSCTSFEEQYTNLNSQEDISALHKTLHPHLLRRLKQDVEKSLPPKIERILRVELSSMQKRFYKLILSRNFKELNKESKGNVASLTNIVVELKKLCNHPYLFGGTEQHHEDRNRALDELILNSGKLLLLDKLLVRLKEKGHRVLIFSQMVRVLDILGTYLSGRHFTFQRLDGSTSAAMRQRAMEHFNAKDSPDFCFLLSTRAGGLGINLTGADTVIIFDSDWNPQNDLQAEARAHRIGQTKTVNIYRLVCKDTVEEEILERAKQKMVLDQVVIQAMDAGGIRKAQNMFSKKDLGAILKFGAESLFKEEESEESSMQDDDDDEEYMDVEVNKPTTNKAPPAPKAPEETPAVKPLVKDESTPPKRDLPPVHTKEPPRRESKNASVLSKKEAKALVDAIKHFGDVAPHFTKVVEAAALSDKDPAFLRTTIADFVMRCRREARKGGSVDLFGYSCRAADVVRSVDSMLCIRTLLEPYMERLAIFRLNNNTLKPLQADWGSQEDAMLVVGSWRHGMEKWAAMCADPELHLDGKIAFSADSVKGVKPAQLKKRLDTILSKINPSLKSSAPLVARRTAHPGHHHNTHNTHAHNAQAPNGAHSPAPAAQPQDGTEHETWQKRCKEYLKDHRAAIKSFREKRNSILDEESRKAATKKFLLHIGGVIDKVIESHGNGDADELKEKLWDYVKKHGQLGDSRSGSLGSFYEKLKSTRRQAS